LSFLFAYFNVRRTKPSERTGIREVAFSGGLKRCGKIEIIPAKIGLAKRKCGKKTT